MDFNITVRTMKKSLSLFLAVSLMLLPLPRMANASSGFEEIQILKGDIYTVTTKGLQRVSVTDPNVADITDAKPEQVVIVGQQAGQTVVFLWDESGKRSFLVRVLSEDLGLIKAKIKNILDNSGVTGVKVEYNDIEGKVMLSGSVPEDQLALINSTAAAFPGNVLNLVQKEEVEDMVQIDMQITELSTTLSKAMGVQWATAKGTGDSLGMFTPGIGEYNVPQTGRVQDLFKLGDFVRTGEIMARVNMLISEGKAKILSKPRLVVRSGKEATFQVGGEIPLTSVTSDTASNKVTQNTTFKSYGVSLAITPTIKKGKVDLLLNTEISDVDAATTETLKLDFAFLTRSAQTQLLMNDHQTIVMAGMIKKNHSETKERVPFFGSIPIIGALFRNTSSPSDKDTEVVISLTSTILRATPRVDEARPVAAAPKDAGTAMSSDEALVLGSGRNNHRLAVIAKNAADVPVTISEDLKPYAQSVQQRVSSAIAYPYEAQENRWQGTVKLALVIRKDGSLRDVFVKESSGYDVFDQDAVNTAQILAPYGTFPSGITQDEITVTLPIVYSLDAFLKNVAKRK